jgi:hypothetical protein
MSDVGAITYGYCTPVTPSDSVDDPSGPFAGLLVGTAGNLVVYPLGGPQGVGTGFPITIAVVSGQYILFPVRRVGATSNTATVFGLVGANVRQGK